jgi:hypothetical protein
VHQTTILNVSETTDGAAFGLPFGQGTASTAILEIAVTGTASVMVQGRTSETGAWFNMLTAAETTSVAKPIWTVPQIRATATIAAPGTAVVRVTSR